VTDDLPDTGRARYFELQRLARTQGRDTQELLILYALEGWLARLAVSSHGDRLVLKGGMLLSAFGQRRPTRDLDVQAQLAADTDTVRDLVAEVADIGIDDGLAMEAAGATAQLIRDADEYSGVRVSVPVGLYSARLTVKVDVNVGDPIWPAPETIRLPRLLNDEPLVLRGYPLHMVLAEKLVTAIARGTASTRWRDFADIYLLIRHWHGRGCRSRSNWSTGCTRTTCGRGPGRVLLARPGMTFRCSPRPSTTRSPVGSVAPARVHARRRRPGSRCGPPGTSLTRTSWTTRRPR
jgi:hypothetical protein